MNLGAIPQVMALSTWGWLNRMGGPGLILLGIADNSVVPLTGSMDVLTIYLAARHREPWFYYAVMATAGAVFGGYITYFLAKKGGKEALEHRLSKRSTQRLYQWFERWGFGAIAVPALLPPPFPMVPFLLAAGALQYPPRKFLAALSIGRGIRFTLIAGLGALYGRSIVRFFSQYYKLALGILVALAIVGTILSIIEYYRLKNRKRTGQIVRPKENAA